MKFCARVSIGGRLDKGKRTPTDPHGQANPAWNFTMKYTVSESMVQHFNAMLVVKLFCKRRLWWDGYIVEVHTSMKELFDCETSGGGSAILSFPVQKGCVNSQGVLRFTYRFGDKAVIDKMLLAETVSGWSQC